MSSSENMVQKKTYWRSLGELADPDSVVSETEREFRDGASELTVDPVSRRQFMGLMGASAALAGVGLSGCIRKPREYIVPFTKNPEDFVPGVARHYASALWVGGTAYGVLVESQDGRPRKIDGNPRHPFTRGVSTAWLQADILNLYDNDRSKIGRAKGGAELPFADAVAQLDAAIAASRAKGGSGLAVVIDDRPSPTFRARLADALRAMPNAKLYRHEPARPAAIEEGLKLAGLPDAKPLWDFGAARTILALDADIFGTDPNASTAALQFSGRRQFYGAETQAENLARLYVVEPTFTNTGATADHRLQLPSSQVGTLLRAIAARVLARPEAAPFASIASALGAIDAGANAKWVEAVAADLIGNAGAAVLVAGERQPAWVHGLVHVLNRALDSVGPGRPVAYVAEEEPLPTQSIEALTTALGAGQVDTVLFLDTNPVYSAPVEPSFASALAKAATSIHVGFHYDETGRACSLHVPLSHALEAWGDLRTADGNAAVQQPLIEPLFPSLSHLDVAGRLAGATGSAHDLVREHWQKKLGSVGFDAAWREWLHEGFIANGRARPAQPGNDIAALASALSAASAAASPTKDALEVVFQVDHRIYDGRYANNAWLQELPDPITKIVWDTVAVVGPKTADAFGLAKFVATHEKGREESSVIRLDVNGKSIEIPAFVSPGVAENVVVLTLGGGRADGFSVASGAGFNAYSVRTSEGAWIATGAKVSKTGRTFTVATTQDHHRMGPEGQPERPIVLETDFASYQANPDFPQDAELMPSEKLKSLWKEPNRRDGQQWGMVIDLSTCIGCSACTIACQAENNISVVGKERVLQGREMHWIRIDRYFRGDDNDPTAVHQPVGCMHCENAPCEQVCPVAATVHGPEGTNDMAYNRCIGTRYCANNCPFKVRRFNYFAFSKENDLRNPLYQMQKNQNVTVRFRGVIEKCTYCIQRVQAAKIEAKAHGTGVVPDGGILTACQQACPTQAITFGDINDPNTKVSQRRRLAHNYALLTWLNIHPRTTYLGKVRNPNPELA